MVDGVAAQETLDEDPPLDKCGKPVTSFQGSATFKVTDISPAGQTSYFIIWFQIGESTTEPHCDPDPIPVIDNTYKPPIKYKPSSLRVAKLTMSSTGKLDIKFNKDILIPDIIYNNKTNTNAIRNLNETRSKDKYRIEEVIELSIKDEES